MGVEGQLQEGGPAQTTTGEGQLTNSSIITWKKQQFENWVKFGDEGAPLRAVLVV